ncbi:hypothetical protein Tco_0994727 [Tanacetum coccineum]
MAGLDDENPPPPPPQQTPTQQAPHTVSTIKLPILKKGEYDIWAMKMEHYLIYTDCPIWEMTDAKEMWDAIKSRFGGNDESKKMQKYILKHQFEGFSCSPLKMPIRSSLGLYLLPDRKVFESNVKGSTGSSSSVQNAAYVSSESTSSTNDGSTAYGVEGCSLMPRNQLALTRLKLSASIAIKYDTLLENAYQKEIKKAEEEMQRTFDIEQKTMGGDLENRRNLKLCNSGSDTEMSVKDKSGLGYGNQIHEGVLSYEKEVLESGFDRPDREVDDSMFTYGPKQSKTRESDTQKMVLGEVKQQPDGIFISQDKYVADILKKFDFCSIKTATTPIVSNKPLVKDEDGVDVDVHVYRSMIGSLMYLTASRPDIMFAVCACARFQVTPKASHLNAVKRIFRYLKHQPKLGLWYPRDSPFELEAFSDSDYGGASLDRKSTTGGCQFLGRRLISWQCKKQTIVANSTTEAEYVAAANYCGQVLWIQNQMMDYGFNFMNTKIHIDNESTICIVKNHVYHSRTKHIEIRHHFIRDCYEKRLIDVIKIHTDANGRQISRLRAIYDAELVSAASLVHTVRPTLSAVRLVSMANLEFVDQHNMVACLEKTEGNFDFHEIVDFLASSSIHHALTINATVDSKAVVVTETSIRSSLLFNDADGTACLGYEAGMSFPQILL